LYLTNAQAGTYVVTIFTTALNTSNTSAVSNTAGPSVTWTVTVTAADTKPTSYQSVVRTGTAAYDSGVDLATDSSTVASTTSSSVAPKFTIYSFLNNTKGEDDSDNAVDSMTVTVSGQAYITADSTDLSSGTGTTSRGTLKAFTMNSGAAPDTNGTPVYVWSTGTAGTATITFTAINSGLTWSKTVTFHGDGSAIAVGTSKYTIARAGGYSTAGMFTVTLKDSSGNAVPAKTLTVTVSDATILDASNSSCADAVGLVTDGTYACTVATATGSTSGQSATVTVTYTDAALAEYSVDYAVTLGGSVSTIALTTDKATYEPGEKMVITATAKDASGNPVYDGASGPSLTANKNLGGTLSMNVYVAGVSTSQTRSSTTGLVTAADTIYAPAASGKFRVSGLDGNADVISVEATVGDDAATAAAAAASDAALEAIDAANAATDAANLAAEAADAATVAAEEARDAADAATAAVEALASEVATLMAALKAQITTLAKTVAKIAKKVKA